MWYNLLGSVPVISQAKGFSELARNVTNCTDPINASIMASKMILEACAPPHIKYPIKCAILLGQIGLCVSTGGLTSVTTASLTIGTAKQILEEIV